MERNTGVHIDHYAEIGFAGFVGWWTRSAAWTCAWTSPCGTRTPAPTCPSAARPSTRAEALAFVRQRKQGDLGRTHNQQKFLAALARKVVRAAR
ncbi:LCP family protein [Streptomyces caelestis]|uniref:Cell envelope-related transcriptional attenuator domain-containing protein n=1 Tax=Streptomyces caelestis TaxID=36816 RepID=A0A7W9H6Z3_9ACTN|nr:LCP family protein [Streptomyces caelestis]MBB5796770.1 hypothetical protein [Streptomyces caelestis]